MKELFKKKLLWSFVGGVPKINRFSARHEVPAVTLEAEAMSRAQSAVKRMAGALQKEFQRARQDQMTTEIVELATAAEVVAGQA